MEHRWNISVVEDCRTEQPKACMSLGGRGKATIDWADGTVEQIMLTSSDHFVPISHTYAQPGIYRIAVEGTEGTLELLFVEDNPTALDISGAPGLKTLLCSGRFASLDLARNSELEVLFCEFCGLTSLDLNGCPNLKELHCDGNLLNRLDLRHNEQLEALSCFACEFTTLDVSANTRLESLICYENELTALDLTRNTELEVLWCHWNELTELDLRMNRKLGCLWCHYNHLSAEAMNRIYHDLPVRSEGELAELEVDTETAGDYTVAEQKGWKVSLRKR